jgi:short-subunit dehydrogenase involved in D-alanine esterification of teichoic acids
MDWIYDTFECRDFLQFYRAKYERLDILINNAAQTVRRPAGFYTHLMANEERR